eukprot:CAMPEP_0206451428 /NCGR_PEP_ID=MMETSP0324_2-20121206/19333_1 /ASSEMBLY_ACC=CAM_ASM_000836 /TAXON_ID=2866 /ORGANISM="Crypthecodinium cohnii, Strain Seligo" /LENGTH=419 /DNA_ID=CAMNT_0053921303 /DNA_START=130 /DNA_END=1389 /DNA_ORIENTATION=+
MIGSAARQALRAAVTTARPRAGRQLATSRGGVLARTALRSTTANPWTLAVSNKRSFCSGGTIQIKTPEFGAESITEGTLQEWNKKAGDFVEEGEIIAVIETDKVSVEVKAEKSGTLVEILAQPEDTVEVGQPLANFKPGGTAPPKKAEEPKPAAEQPKEEAKAPAPAAAEPAAAAPASGPARSEKRVKMNRMRKSIARSMKEAQNTTCMLTTFQEVDMNAIINLRKEYKDEFEGSHGIRLGFMGAFVKASTYALQQIPAVNAFIDDAKQEIVYRDYCDISVAVASPKGLVVPVIRDAQAMTIADVEGTIGELALKARNDALGMEDMMNGTFTITNGGVFGSMLSTPILNTGFGPQSAILGMHFTKPRPTVLKNGDIVPRPVMYLALSYDHRLVDGREAVTFLCMVRDQIEDPRRLLLGC